MLVSFRQISINIFALLFIILPLPLPLHTSQMTALKPNSSLKDIFADPNYAWELLQAEVRMETSELQAVSGQDISSLLQLYMRGVEKMNTLADIRQSFFKNKVTSLMSRPTVIKILNKPMTKKSQPAMADCVSPQNSKNSSEKQEPSSGSAKKIAHTEKELQLKSKKQSLQMRLAYSAQENNPDALRKMMAQHSQKESLMTEKIVKIVDSHQERLRKRISQRKIRTVIAKQKSQRNFESQIGENNIINYQDIDSNFKDIRIETQQPKIQQKYESSPIKSNKPQGMSEKKIQQQGIRQGRARKSASLQHKKTFQMVSIQEQQKQKSKLHRKTSLQLNNNNYNEQVISNFLKQYKIPSQLPLASIEPPAE